MKSLSLILNDDFQKVSFFETLQKIIRPNYPILKINITVPRWIEQILLAHIKRESAHTTLTKRL